MQHNVHRRLVHHLRHNFRASTIPCSSDSRRRHWYCQHGKSHVLVRKLRHRYQWRRKFPSRNERIYRVNVSILPGNLDDVRVTAADSCNSILYSRHVEHVFLRNWIFLGGKRSNDAIKEVRILQRHRKSSQ